MFSYFRALFSPDKELVIQIRNIFGFYPVNISLYTLALRHKSAPQKNGHGVKISNERLEFLGDAILDAIVADYLFKRFPYKDEGFLTQMRSKIVSRNHLNKLALKLGFNHLIKSTPDQNFHNKSMLGDAFEAFVGALYLDKGYAKAERLIVNHILRMHVDIEELMNQDTNYKSKLIEWAQHYKRPIEFNVVEEIGSGYNKQYIIEILIDGEPRGRGRDYSIKGAEQHAAGKVCENLILIESNGN